MRKHLALTLFILLITAPAFAAAGPDLVTVADKSDGDTLSGAEFTQILDSVKSGTRSAKVQSILINGVQAFLASGLEGAAAGDLATIPTAKIQDGAIAITTIASTGVSYLHYYSIAGTDSEAVPTVIRPNDYSSAGVWKLSKWHVSMLPATITGVSFDLGTPSVGAGEVVTVDANGVAQMSGIVWPTGLDATELGYVNGVTSAIQTQLDAKVAKATYDAHSILYATTDDTPAALTIAEQRVVGRVTSGNIAALTLGNAAGNVAQWPAEPAAHTLFGFDNTGNIYRPITIGAGLSYDQASNTISAPGLTDLDDLPGDTVDDNKIDGDLVAISGLAITSSGLTAGSVYYQASGGLTAARANSATTMPGVCIAKNTTQCVFSGVYQYGSSQGWTAGALIYVSGASAGALVTTAPSTSGYQVQRVGVALAADTILIMPSLDVGTVQ